MNTLTLTQIKTLEKINNFEVVTEWDKIRLNKAIERLNRDINRNGNYDSGLFGKVSELLSHDSYSTSKDVKPQKYIDVNPIVDGIRVKAEHKVNGGRIEHLYRVKDKDNTYVIYEMDFIPPTRTLKDGTIKHGIRRTAYKIMKLNTFLELLESTKAIKITEHKDYLKSDKERAIQVSSKKFYNALITGGYADYIVNKTYSSKNIK